MEVRRVALHGEAKRAGLPEAPLVLPHRRTALGVAVLAEAVALVDFGAPERVRALARRPPEAEHAFRPEAAGGVAGGQAALREAELIVGAASNREVSLPRIERPLEHAQRFDQLGDDEVRVGVAVPVQ